MRGTAEVRRATIQVARVLAGDRGTRRRIEMIYMVDFNTIMQRSLAFSASRGRFLFRDFLTTESPDAFFFSLNSIQSPQVYLHPKKHGTE